MQIASAALDQLPVQQVGGGTILADEGAAAAGAGDVEEEGGAEPMDVDGEAGPSSGEPHQWDGLGLSAWIRSCWSAVSSVEEALWDVHRVFLRLPERAMEGQLE